MIRVTIWNEYWHELNEPVVGKMYPHGIHKALADGLADDDFEITTTWLEKDEWQGLSQELLDNTDVLLWWGHCRHSDVNQDTVERVVAHVLDGMGFIPMHSAHASRPFGRLMGTHCTLQWRDINEHARVWCVNPAHPIAKGIPMSFELSNEEMYGEFFNVPQPDDLVFISWYEGGEVFRGGCTWTRGEGKIFYFHPGHETCPSFYNPTVLQVLKNGIRWAAKTHEHELKGGWRVEPLEPISGVPNEEVVKNFAPKS